MIPWAKQLGSYDTVRETIGLLADRSELAVDPDDKVCIIRGCLTGLKLSICLMFLSKLNMLAVPTIHCVPETAYPT